MQNFKTNSTYPSQQITFKIMACSINIIGVCTDTYVIYQSVLEKKTYEWLTCDS